MKLARFVALKILGGFVTLFFSATLAFIVSRVAGDPTIQMLGLSATADQIVELKAQLGYDRPMLTQYAEFIGHVYRGDLGVSLYTNDNNLSAILERVPASLQLASLAVLLGVLIGIPVGAFAAIREGSMADRVASILSIVAQSVPIFWLGLMLVLVFSLNLGWLPAGFIGDWRNLVLPVVTLAAIPTARIARLTRATMTSILEEPFVRAAFARGLPRRRVVYSHALRNSLLPVVTVIGLQFGILLSGAITVELVFAWPGVGSLATQAVMNRDLPLVQALVVFGAATFVGINIVVDIIYGLIDPRIREKT